MVARRWRKYPEDDAEPLAFTPMDWEKIKSWQDRALELREAGLSIRKIARAVGKCYSQVQRLVTPGSHEKEMRRKAERERERRAADPEYLEMGRTYRRKWNQAVAPRKWKQRETKGVRVPRATSNVL